MAAVDGSDNRGILLLRRAAGEEYLRVRCKCIRGGAGKTIFYLSSGRRRKGSEGRVEIEGDKVFNKKDCRHIRNSIEFHFS